MDIAPQPPELTATTVARDRLRVRYAVIGAAGLVVGIWLAWLGAWSLGWNMDDLGIRPRDAHGLIGILSAPFVHASFEHLMSNTLPLGLLASMALYAYPRATRYALPLVWLVSGLGVWLISPSNTTTVGASGIVFGWLAFLIVRGIWTRTWQHILLGLVLLVLYGSLFWTGIVKVAAADITGVVTVSWQAHLFGAIGGVLAAFLVAKADGPRRAANRAAIGS